MADNERDWRLYEREYDLLDDHRIEEILDDTGRDSPNSDYCDAEVYSLAREVAWHREMERARELKKQYDQEKEANARRLSE